jgi:DNA-directed RNA polymerase subunit L
MVQYKFLNEEIFPDGVKVFHFTLSRVTTEEANAIRRTVLMNIPVIGIGNTKVLINETSFPSEMIISRLQGIYLNNKGLEEKENLKFEITCPENEVLFDVESQMIKPLEGFITPRMHIVSLKPGQRLSISFDLIRSSSIIHNHYSCASAVGFSLVEDKFIAGTTNVSTIAADKTYQLSIETTGVHEAVFILKTAINILIGDFEKARVRDADLAIRVTKIDENRIVVIIPNNQYTLSQTIACYLLMMDKSIIRAAGSKMPDQLQPNSEVHVTGENPLENYHKAIDKIQHNYRELLGQISGAKESQEQREPRESRESKGSSTTKNSTTTKGSRGSSKK